MNRAEKLVSGETTTTDGVVANGNTVAETAGADAGDATQAESTKTTWVTQAAPAPPTSALGNEPLEPSAHEACQEQQPRQGQLMEIAVDVLVPAQAQARTIWDAKDLQGLADSIAVQGVLIPLIARAATQTVGSKEEKSRKGKSREESKMTYELIAGERRLRAARMAGLTHVPVLVQDMSDEQALLAGLAENLQRANLSVLEEGAAFEKALALPGFSYRTLSTKLGLDKINKGYIEERVRAHRSEPDVRGMIEKRPDTLTHARVIGAMTDAKARVAAIKATIDGASLKEIRLLAKSAEPTTEPTIEPTVVTAAEAVSEATIGSSDDPSASASGHPDEAAPTSGAAVNTAETMRPATTMVATQPSSDEANDVASINIAHKADVAYGSDTDAAATYRYAVLAEEAQPRERHAPSGKDWATERLVYELLQFQDLIERAKVPMHEKSLLALRAALEKTDTSFRVFWKAVFDA